MRTIPFVGWIANAAARWVGTHGTVTATAQQTGCSRQCVYDHAHKVLAAVEAEHGGDPPANYSSRRTPSSATRTPNSGTGCSRPSSSLGPCNSSSPSRPWPWA